MTRPRILVTDAGSTKALAVVRALGPSAEVWTTSAARFPLGQGLEIDPHHLGQERGTNGAMRR